MIMVGVWRVGGEGRWRVERVLMLGKNCWPEEYQLFKTVEYHLLKGLGKLGDSSGLMLSL